MWMSSFKSERFQHHCVDSPAWRSARLEIHDPCRMPSWHSIEPTCRWAQRKMRKPSPMLIRRSQARSFMMDACQHTHTHTSYLIKISLCFTLLHLNVYKINIIDQGSLLILRIFGKWQFLNFLKNTGCFVCVAIVLFRIEDWIRETGACRKCSPTAEQFPILSCSVLELMLHC